MPDYARGTVADRSPNPSDPRSNGAVQTPRLSLRDQLKRCRHSIEVARNWRKQEQYDDTWKRLVDIYRNKHFEGESDEDRIAINLSFATINVIGPSVSMNYPKITVNARLEEFDPQAAIAQAVVNYWWRHYNVKREFRRAVDDWLIMGHAWLKVGYRYREKQQPRAPEDVQSELQDLSAQADQYAEENPELAADLPTDEEIAQFVDEYETTTVEDRPFVERVSPFDIYVDPEATSVDDACWIAQRLVRSVADVRNDRRYKASARRAVRADGSLRREWQDDSEQAQRKDDVQRVTLWEFYDLKNGTVSVFANEGEEYLIRPTPMPYPFGHPFVMMRNYDVPDYFYPIGELETLEPLQRELNKTRSQLVQYRRKQQRKYLYKREAFGQEGVRALQSDRDNELVPVEGDLPFEQLIAPLKQEAMDPQLYTYSDVIENDFDRISGVSEYLRGDVPELRRTATEAAIIQQAANSRAADKLAQVEEVIAEVAERLVQLAQAYVSGEQTVRVVGMNGATLWVPFRREDIEGEFDFEVEAGSTQPQDDTARRQQALQMLQQMQPFIGTVLDPAKFIIYVLREGFGMQNAQQYLAPPAPPPGPDEKLVTTMAYKDAPPDIQRQIEQEAGYAPSTIGGSSPVETALASAASSSGGAAPAPAAEGEGDASSAEGDDTKSSDPRVRQRAYAALLAQLDSQIGTELVQ